MSFREGPTGRLIEAKFVLSRGLARLVGLRLDDGQPVTARLLRQIRIASLEKAFTEFLAHEREDHGQLEGHLDAAYEDASDDELEELHDSSRVLAEMRHEVEAWIEQLDAGEKAPLTKRGRGAAPPSDAELRNFSAIYLRQQLRGRGAISRTAREVGMDRTTVYRWIERCQIKDFLPTNHEENK